MAVLEAVDFCYNCLDSKHFVLGIYFDLQKAFDTVDQDTLLQNLYNYGIRGPIYITGLILPRKSQTIYVL